MTYLYPTPVEISYKIVRWQGRPVRLVRLLNEPAGPSAFVNPGELPEADHNADAAELIWAELHEVFKDDRTPIYLETTRFFPPVAAGLENFPAHAFEDDAEGWTSRTLSTTFQ